MLVPKYRVNTVGNEDHGMTDNTRGFTLPFFSLILPGLILAVVSPASFLFESGVPANQVISEYLPPFMIIFFYYAVAIAVITVVFPAGRSFFALSGLITSVWLMITSQVYNPDLGFVVDGSNTPLSVAMGPALTEIAVLIALGAVLVAKYRKNVGGTALPLAIAAAWALVSLAVSGPDNKQDRAESRLVRSQTTWDKTSIAKLSPQKNMLHFMLDSLQTDMFLEIMNESDDLRKSFAGFEVFENHAGYSNWTTFSVFSILGGMLYFEQTGRTAVEMHPLAVKSVTQKGLPSKLVDEGFDVFTLMPSDGFCEETTFDCAFLNDLSWPLTYFQNKLEPESSGWLPFNGLQREIVNLTAMRAIPTLFANSVYRNGKWLFGPGPGKLTLADLDNNEQAMAESLGVLSWFTDRVRMTDVKPTYKFFHLFPPHKPWIFDKDCRIRQPPQEIDPDQRWPYYKDHAICALKRFAQMLNRLNEIGALTNTTIILQSDTGLGVYKNDIAKGYSHLAEPLHYLGASQVVQYAQPLLAIRKAGTTKPFSISRVPSHHIDTLPTVLELLGIKASDRVKAGPIKARSVYALDDAPRARPFVISSYLSRKLLRPFTKYEIIGDVMNPKDWKKIGQFSAPGQLAKQEGTAVTDLSVKIEPVETRVAAGDALKITANALPADIDKEYVMMYRFKETRLGRGKKLRHIKRWSPSNTANWIVPTPGTDVCFLLITVIARGISQVSRGFTKDIILEIETPACQ